MDLLKDLKFVIFLNMFGVEFQSQPSNRLTILITLNRQKMLYLTFTTAPVPPGIHTQLDFWILADVSIYETGLGRFGLVIFTN